MEKYNIVFGPIPSRRLGRSLGINNIPPKICSYSCVYCQLGRAIEMDYERSSYYTPESIFKAVDKKVEKFLARNEAIDYLTFVPDGESTLDINLGKEVQLLKHFGIKQAIITNASMLFRTDVREELMDMDLVSVKVDAFTEPVWKKVNRPHKMLKIDDILTGIQKFSEQYKGKLITETMLINGYNDHPEEIKGIAEYISTLQPEIAYLSIPTRPPARKEILPASERSINHAFQLFSEKVESVEYLLGHEGNAFAHTGDTRSDILSITAVHPMREDSVREFLEKDRKDWSLIENLVNEEKIIETTYGDHKFYVRKLTNRQQV